MPHVAPPLITVFFYLASLILSILISPSNSLRFALPELDETTGSTVEVEEGGPGGSTVQVPRGIYHFSDSEQTVRSKFKVPDFQEVDPLRMASDLMGAAASAQTRRRGLSGISLPLPFGGTPLNLQVSSDTRSSVGTSEAEGAESTTARPIRGEAKTAFELARRVCLQSTEESCDEALDTYHRARYGSSLLSSLDEVTAPPPSSPSEDPSTALATLLMPSLRKRLSDLSENTSRAPPTPRPLNMDVADSASSNTHSPAHFADSRRSAPASHSRSPAHISLQGNSSEARSFPSRPAHSPSSAPFTPSEDSAQSPTGSSLIGSPSLSPAPSSPFLRLPARARTKSTHQNMQDFLKRIS